MGAGVFVKLEERGQGATGLGVSLGVDLKVLAEPSGTFRAPLATVPEHGAAPKRTSSASRTESP